MPDETTQIPGEATTPEQLLNQWATSLLKLIGIATSLGGQTGNFGHLPDSHSATVVGMLAVHIQDSKLRETLLAGVAEFVNRFTLPPDQTSCLALAQSILLQTETTPQLKAQDIAQLNGCKGGGYIRSEEYTILLEKLESMKVGSVLQRPGP